MKTCDSHVNEEVKFVTLPPSYCPRILDLVYDVAEQIKHYNRIGDLGKSWNLEELKTQRVLWLQTIKAIVDSCSFKSPKSDEPRRMQVLDLYCLTKFESEGLSKGIVY